MLFVHISPPLDYQFGCHDPIGSSDRPFLTEILQ